MNFPNIVEAIYGDSRKLQIVQKLIEQTRSRKLIWSKKGLIYEARLKEGTRVGFVGKEISNVFLARILPLQGWAQFSVRRKDDSEVFKVEAESLMLGITNPAERSPLQNAIDELFSLIAQREGEELDQILNELG